MKIIFQFFFLFCIGAAQGYSQTNRVLNLIPQGTVLHGNVPYNKDTLQKHLLDIYLPPNAKGKLPLVIFIDGGGWLSNN